MSGGERAFSLIEVMVASALLLLLLGLIVQVVVPMGKGSVRGAQQVELQQVSVLALDRLGRDLEAAAPSGITYFPPKQRSDATRLAVHRLVDVDAAGGNASQVYAGDLVVYWWSPGERRLRRKTWPPAPPAPVRAPTADQVFVPTSSELDAIIAADNGTERVAAGQVKEFSVSLAPAGADLHLVLEAPPPDGQPPERYELNRTLFLRNQEY